MKMYARSIIAVLMLVGLSACTPKGYSKFKSDVITPEKPASNVDNCQATKPKGAKGRLVIFQAGATRLTNHLISFECLIYLNISFNRR